MSAKQRIDVLLAERGLAGSRTSAAASVRAGRVRIGTDGPFATKPGQLVAADADLILSEPQRYVSRGGIKLENALAAFAVEVEGRRCLDVGASTGGFTDCLLQHGAEAVIALDVAHGQLDWGLRNDQRVTVIERLNARELDPGELPFEPSLATIDVSFISLAKVLPRDRAQRPRREATCWRWSSRSSSSAPSASAGAGWFATPPTAARRSARSPRRACACGLAVRGFASSGLPGPKGNRETFIHFRVAGEPIADLEAAIARVEP